MVIDARLEGAMAFEHGLSFIQDNPYHPWFDERHYTWSEGYLAQRRKYEDQSRLSIQKEDEEYNLKVLKEKEEEEKKKELILSERKFRKSKKGKAEAAGQTTLF